MADVHVEAVQRLERMGALLKGDGGRSSLQEHLEGRARLIAAVETMHRRGPGARWGSLALTAVAATAMVVFGVVRARSHAPLSWRVESGVAVAPPGAAGGSSDPGARLVFDDGSEVALAPGARGRVVGTTHFGAEVVLEQGRARVHVQHRDGARWVIEAGPFSVRVTGTEFSMAWGSDSATLDVWMRAGRVVVTGPGVEGSLALSTGQHVRARVGEGSFQLDGERPPEDSVTGPSSAPGPAPASAPAKPSPTQAEGSGASPGAPAVSWTKLVGAGDYAQVVHQAQADVDRALASRSLADLRALGDAARYVDSSSLAERAYLAIRDRFRSTSDARAAAFLLGRVAEEQRHDDRDAVRWYDTYVTESAKGPYAGDALGRKMLLVSESSGRDSARPFATEYLRRFPEGPYSTAAHHLAP